MPPPRRTRRAKHMSAAANESHCHKDSVPDMVSLSSDSSDSSNITSESSSCWNTVDLSYRSTSSSDQDASIKARQHQHRRKLMTNNESSSSPVTGRHSDILEDYMVFPGALGKGHYGCVRECIHRATWQSYACKSIEKCKIQRLDHLQNEIRLLSEMDHDGIIKMIDCYEDADYLHIVTEKCTGGELFDKIVDNKTGTGICLSEHRAACIIKSVLEAVAYLHENDIVHRDIKPENILFESAETETAIKLIDFGLSRRHQRGAEPSVCSPVGTCYYMSPELIKGKYDKSCDLWAIGTITFILLCGYPPFNGNNDEEIFQAIHNAQFEFPPHHWVCKSKESKEFIECLLQRDSRERVTAREALEHPWIANLGNMMTKEENQRERNNHGGVCYPPRGKKDGKKKKKHIRYLKIP